MCSFIELFFVTFIIDRAIILFVFEKFYIHFLQFITFSLMLRTFTSLFVIFSNSQFLTFAIMINSHLSIANFLAPVIHTVYALMLSYFQVILFLVLI
jgi:hypothetical protein